MLRASLPSVSGPTLKQLNGMQPESTQNLAELLSAGEEILEIAGPEGVGYVTSRRDALAVERLFEIVGESLARVRNREPSLLDHITNAAEIIGFRNVLAHGYDQIDSERVLSIITIWLPVLMSDVNDLMSKQIETGTRKEKPKN